MSHITQELPAFEAWFQAIWLGDEEHGQRIPSAISDPLYSKYLEDRNLALGAWMHRAALAQPEPVEPNNDEVICPNCVHQFRAIPQNVQRLMLDAGFEPPFKAQPEPVALKWTPVEEWWESGNEDFDKLKDAVVQMLAAAKGSQQEPVEPALEKEVSDLEACVRKFALEREELLEEAKRLKAQPDCRTCANSFDSYEKANCISLEVCTNGDQYQPAPKVVLWRTG